MLINGIIFLVFGPMFLFGIYLVINGDDDGWVLIASGGLFCLAGAWLVYNDHATKKVFENGARKPKILNEQEIRKFIESNSNAIIIEDIQKYYSSGQYGNVAAYCDLFLTVLRETGDADSEYFAKAILLQSNNMFNLDMAKRIYSPGKSVDNLSQLLGSDAKTNYNNHQLNSQIYSSIGYYEQMQSNFENAIKFYSMSLRELEALPIDKAGNSLLITANDLAAVEYGQFEMTGITRYLESAKTHYEQALALAREENGELRDYSAEIANHLVDALQDLGKNDQAKSLLLEILTFYELAETGKYHKGGWMHDWGLAISTCNALSSIYENEGNDVEVKRLKAKSEFWNQHFLQH